MNCLGISCVVEVHCGNKAFARSLVQDICSIIRGEVLTMVFVKLIPTYRFVKSKCLEDVNLVELAYGKALDTALCQYNYYQSRSMRSLLNEAMRCGMKVFSMELKMLGINLSSDEKRRYAWRMWRMLCCWRKSKYFDMFRPKTHIILLEKYGELYGVFAQPDFWDDGVFYEVKSFDVERNERLKKCVTEQCRVFSLLGDLRLVYFVENDAGYFSLIEKPIERDITVLDELWDYISSLNNTQYDYEDLEELEEIYPMLIYRFNENTNKWEYIEYKTPSIIRNELNDE